MGKGPNFFHPETWSQAGILTIDRQGPFGTELQAKRSYECPRCHAIVVEPISHRDWHIENEKEGQ